MRQHGCKTRFWLVRILLGVLIAGGVLLGPQAASAVDNGPTQTGEICMQKVFGTPVANSNRLNCTANDIRISRATSAINKDTGDATCVASGTSTPSTFTLEATFETIVTANTRYDAGFFFRIDGGSNARGDGTAAEGICSLSALDPGVPPALNLDGDTCGDLNAGTYLLTFTIENVACVDSDGDGFVNLPNCTSWHSNQGTTCDIDTASSFHPDTKSKCVCDDTFQIPITVESPSGAVVKTATKAVVTYEVKVKNNSSSRTVKINSINDDIYGDLATRTGSTCGALIDTTLAPGATSAACTFTAEYLNPGTEGNKTNTVTAHVTAQSPGPADEVDLTGSTTINVDLNVTVTPP